MGMTWIAMIFGSKNGGFNPQGAGNLVLGAI